MKAPQHITLAIILVVSMTTVWAQSDAGQTSTDGGQQQTSTPPAGAFGQEAPTPQVAQFPPLSSLDEPSLEPHFATRSFFSPGFMISELADSNPGNARITGTGTFSGDTHLLGNFALQRYWRRYQTLLDYSGGGVLYSGPHQVPNSQVHSLNFDQAIMWRTGLMQIRNNFSYLPEGFFGGGFGGSLGMASVPGGGSGTGLGGFGGGGGTNFFGTGQFGALGVAPRITDRAIIDV
jgi:hypothetical protein